VALEENWTASVKSSAVAIAALGILSTLASTLIVLLKVANPAQTIGCLLVALVCMWAALVFGVEMERLRKCRLRLQELYENQKLYENLLDDARRERDQALFQVQQATAEYQVQLRLMAAKSEEAQ